jgi:hypothetical protein
MEMRFLRDDSSMVEISRQEIMSDIWPRVSKQNPCPVCRHSDWCQYGDRAIKCMRVQSKRRSRDGGWYHSLAEELKLRPLPKREKPTDSEPINFESKIATWKKETNPKSVQLLAEKLGLNWPFIDLLDVCWSRKDSAWAFPMRNGFGKIVGIRLRSEDGQKWSVGGSSQGLFYSPVLLNHDPILICEGPTSTAAALQLGFYAVGRPSCSCAPDQVNDLIVRLKIRKAIIVADNDRKWRLGRFWSPGMEGALRLSDDVRCKHVIWTPPQKDIRDFLKAGGNRDLILSQVKDMLWS